MPIKLPLINKEDVYRPVVSSPDEFGFLFILVVVFIVALVVLPIAWKFVLLFFVIATGGYLLDKYFSKQPSINDKDFIEFSTDNIHVVQNGSEITLYATDIVSIHLWSDFYRGYAFDMDTHNGDLQITLTLKDGQHLNFYCTLEHELHYKTTLYALKGWYAFGLAITEAIGHKKHIGFLMAIQGNYTFAELQAMKAELGIS